MISYDDLQHDMSFTASYRVVAPPAAAERGPHPNIIYYALIFYYLDDAAALNSCRVPIVKRVRVNNDFIRNVLLASLQQSARMIHFIVFNSVTYTSFGISYARKH